ncbi:MAG TPA: hypothetical protein VMC07_03330 [Candidatus Omnitrophota bacterium]|nr:hypothetical protein [Candidatus Omnitrophota bacterium]
MDKCFRCGASSENTIIYDAISKDGLVKICGTCNIRENFPVLKKSGAPPEEKRQTVYERLTSMSGFNTREREAHRQQENMKKQNEEVKQVLDKRFRDEMMTGLKREAGGDEFLVRNFHWEIMKARRARHLTQEQLADNIGESVLAVKMAERGMLPREKERLVRKIENYLKIKILNTPEPVQMPAQPAEEAPIEEIKKKFSIRELFGFGKKKEEKNE